jgi:hypothetical protein
MKIFETSLPVFRGVYGNYWDDYCPIDEKGNQMSWERYDIDYKKMLENIGESTIDWLKNNTELFELVGIESMRFIGSWSPKEYNFHNDIIDIEVTVSNHSKLPAYIYDNYETFMEEIRYHHTSRDGYNSQTSNSIEEWREETNGFTNFEDNGNYLHFLLNVVCEIEEYKEVEAYYYWYEDIYESDFCTIQEMTWETVDLEQIFTENVEKIDWEYGDTQFIKADAVRKSSIFGTDWINEIDDNDKINLLESIGLEPEQFDYVAQ